MIEIDLGARYAAAFGLFSKQNQSAIVTPTGNAYSFEYFDQDNSDFEDMSLFWQDKHVNFGALPFNKSIGNILAPPPMIDFYREKKWIETPVNDSEDLEGIERWRTKGYRIRMKGLLIDADNRTYPDELVRTLHKFFEFNGVVNVEGVRFENKDIYHLLIKNISFNGVKGFQDTIQYTMEAKPIASIGFTLLNP